MLLYLSTNTRPDISFAVSQLARFSNNPKQNHAKAMKHLIRYLRGTKDKGTIIRPSLELMFNMWVDADFMGLYNVEPHVDPTAARSRMAYIICLGNWPIAWKSTLIAHICQSSFESEYAGISYALKMLIPIQKMVQELLVAIDNKKLTKEQVKIKARVFEDNQAAYNVAKNQRITSRTRYMLNKWHWFHQELNKGTFTIEHCPTDRQWADWMTKPLDRSKFETNRKAIMGW